MCLLVAVIYEKDISGNIFIAKLSYLMSISLCQIEQHTSKQPVALLDLSSKKELLFHNPSFISNEHVQLHRERL